MAAATEQLLQAASSPPSRMQTVKRVGAGMLVGAAAFWLPSAIWHLVRGDDFRGRDILGLTVLIPLIMHATTRILQRRVPLGRAPNYMPLAACVGAWLFGPFYLLAHSIAASTLPPPGGWTTLLFAFAVFPAATFSIATYDGTLFALGLSTVLMILLASEG